MANRQDLQPWKKRKETKQPTRDEPKLEITAHKLENGPHFRLKLWSYTKVGIASVQLVKWEGTELGFIDRLRLAAVLMCEHQFRVFGDAWDVKEISHLAVDRYRELVSRFGELNRTR